MDDDFRAGLDDKEPHFRVGIIRRHIGLSQKDVATKLGVHWITISRIERGSIRLSREWITRLAKALSVNEVDIAPDGEPAPDVRVIGEVQKGGKVFVGEKILYSSKSRINGESYYLSVSCDDFEPVLRRLDVIKMTLISENQKSAAMGRMCLAKSNGISVIGFLGTVPDNEEHPSSMWDTFVMRDIKGKVILDKEFIVTSIATEITLIPSGF